VYRGTRDEMTGSSSDDWILLALQLQPLLITFNHNAIAIPHTLQLLHTNPLSLFPSVVTTLAVAITTTNNYCTSQFTDGTHCTALTALTALTPDITVLQHTQSLLIAR
jgi:hypothetical protein